MPAPGTVKYETPCRPALRSGGSDLSKRPLDLLHGALGKRVVVELKGGRAYHGVLDGYDHPHLNLVLTQAEEFLDGESMGQLDSVVVRGDNVVFVLPP